MEGEDPLTRVASGPLLGKASSKCSSNPQFSPRSSSSLEQMKGRMFCNRRRAGSLSSSRMGVCRLQGQPLRPVPH